MEFEPDLIGSAPEPHREFVNHAVGTLSQVPWLDGIVATGSLANATMDAYSDLDLVLAIEPDALNTAFDNRQSVAERLGVLLTSFTGEHVGQPQLLMCLFGPPLLHVDLYFVPTHDALRRHGNPIILWERDRRLTDAPRVETPPSQPLDPQWVEDRFWVWVHKACGKIARGELFEALEYLAVFRSRVLGPLALQAAGKPPFGLRRIETVAPTTANAMRAAIGSHEAGECLAALRASVDIYRDLRDAFPGALVRRDAAERAVMANLAELEVLTITEHMGPADSM